MSETKWTPWEFVLIGTTPMVKIPGGKLCADFTDSGATIGESIAHAKLTAAAPEMAAALQMLRRHAAMFGAFRDDIGQTIAHEVDAILAKIEGRQP